jgi:hypothetical protein
LPLRADREERLQQRGPQQVLGRERRPPDRRVELVEQRRQPRQGGIHQRADLPQGMVLRYPRLRVHIAAQMAAVAIFPAHRPFLPLCTQEIRSLAV